MTDYNCGNGIIMTLEPGLHEVLFEWIMGHPFGMVWEVDPRFMPALRPTVKALHRSGCEVALYERYGSIWLKARTSIRPPLGDGFTDDPEGW